MVLNEIKDDADLERDGNSGCREQYAWVLDILKM
jgi:hypothetical protein